MTENNSDAVQKAVLIGLNAETLPPDQRSSDETLDELEALLETAGGISVGRVLQNRRSPEPRTYIGEGKTREVKELAKHENAVIAVFDNELSPSQTKALEDELGIRVLDRSALILDIFAQRARTKEGRIQVELAQYKYLLPRLTRMWTHLERQAGTSQPIGTRGPGETQLETDRRHIRRKIQKLEEELESVRRDRATQRRLRLKNKMPVLALVGYTNAGKSTLMRLLSGADVTAGDRLFDTLDTTTRKVKIGEHEVLLSDTVGFIRKLPHHLIEAFRATLEELKFADVIVHIIDASNENWRVQRDVTDSMIAKLDCAETPRIEIFNKIDRDIPEALPHGEFIVEMSAATGKGLENLAGVIGKILNADKKVLRVPYSEAAVIERMYALGSIREVRYEDDAVYITTHSSGDNRLGEYAE